MFRRPTQSVLALAAAGLYAVTGAIELTHDQPAVFSEPVDYWIEGAFVGALALSVAVLASLARLGFAGRLGAVGWSVAAGGHGCLLIAATVTLLQGQEALDPLFVIGFLGIVVAYLTLAGLDLRRRLVPERAGLVLLAGFAATIVVDNVVSGTGGLVLAATWAAFARLLSTTQHAATAGARQAAAARR